MDAEELEGIKNAGQIQIPTRVLDVHFKHGGTCLAHGSPILSWVTQEEDELNELEIPLLEKLSLLPVEGVKHSERPERYCVEDSEYPTKKHFVKT